MTHPINSYQNCDDESHVHPYDTNVEAKHQELVELVSKGTMKQDNRDFSIKVAVDSAKALLSVVEIHSPDYDEVNGDVCPQCSEGEYWTPYPCPTIEAIEKALV